MRLKRGLEGDRDLKECLCTNRFSLSKIGIDDISPVPIDTVRRPTMIKFLGPW